MLLRIKLRKINLNNCKLELNNWKFYTNLYEI